MADAVTVALGALRTAERKTGAIAHRIANVNTDGGADDRDGTAATAPSGETGDAGRDGLPADRVTIGGVLRSQDASAVNLGDEIIALGAARREYQANGETLKTALEMEGTILDIFG